MFIRLRFLSISLPLFSFIGLNTIVVRFLISKAKVWRIFFSLFKFFFNKLHCNCFYIVLLSIIYLKQLLRSNLKWQNCWGLFTTFELSIIILIIVFKIPLTFLHVIIQSRWLLIISIFGSLLFLFEETFSSSPFILRIW